MPFKKKDVEIESRTFQKFLDSVEGMEHNTIKDYKTKIKRFSDFCDDSLKTKLDDVVRETKDGKIDKYDLLNDYKRYLVKKEKKTNNLKALIKKARTFLEFHDIEYSDKLFRNKIRLPRSVRKEKTPIAKLTIREIVVKAPNPYLRGLLLLVAATGMRPIEAVSIRHKDLDLDGNPGRVTIRAEYTKMKKDRYVFLTREVVSVIKELLAFKHRERTLACRRKDGSYYNVQLKPKMRPDDLLFAIYRRDETRKLPKVQSLYTMYNNSLNDHLETIGKDEFEDDGKRHKITEYTLRRYVKSAISNLGFADFSEWLIGHEGSMYWNVEDGEKVKVFRKVEEALTFLDTAILEQMGADMQTQLQHEREQRLTLQEQMQIMARAMAAPDEETKRHELEKLAKTGFFKTQKVE